MGFPRAAAAASSALENPFVVTMMRVAAASRLLQRAVRLKSSPPAAIQRLAGTNTRRWFAVSTPTAEEKPIIPGVGKGKTSTGLVRRLFAVVICVC